LLVRPIFRDHPSQMAVALGLTLEEQLIIQDLAAIGHLMVVGADNPKQHFIRSLLLTLILLNTPAEMRLTMIGQGSQAYAGFVATPHALGRLLTSVEDGQRLLEALTKEMQRRKQLFSDSKVNALDAYNVKLKEQTTTPLPRILLLLDSISEESWKNAADSWSPVLGELLTDGGPAGIHVIFTTESANVPEALRNVNTRVYMRSQAGDLAEKLREFPRPTMRFIDAFVTESGRPEDVEPVELCSVSEGEVTRAVDYWRQASAARRQDPSQGATVPAVSATTGVTGVFTQEQIQRAMSSREANYAASLARTAPLPPLSQAMTPRQELRNESNTTVLKQAEALAAYLGWLGVGPLKDVLALEEGDARAVIISLQTSGVIEKGESAILRFIRLSDNPLQS
jgi:hypothetical protein